MNKKSIVAVLGGDERQTRLASILAADGRQVRVYGTDGDAVGVLRCRDVGDAVASAHAVIFPLPAVKGGAYLNEKSESLTAVLDILDKVDRNAVVFAGKADAAFVSGCRDRGLSFVDYYDSEPLTVKNAELTAEGALNIYMNEKKVALIDSRILVLGSGRVAKCVARVFYALGARVTVMARNRGELAWAKLQGWDTADINDGDARFRLFSSGYDAIINTIPVTFISGCCLSVIPEGTFVIDLASSPYGVDITEARRRGVNVHRAASLPGKYAPESAARIIAEEIKGHLNHLGGVT